MNLTFEIENFFEAYKEKFSRQQIFVVRSDGLVLFSNGSKKNEQTIGALVGGVWQASEALSAFLPQSSNKDYRLAFDTSDQGLYVVPLDIVGQQLFLALFFTGEINPAFIKSQLRLASIKLSQFINKQNESKTSSNVRKSYLFSEIKDEEMDALFSFTGV